MWYALKIVCGTPPSPLMNLVLVHLQVHKCMWYTFIIVAPVELAQMLIGKSSSIQNSSTTQNLKKSCKISRAQYYIFQISSISVAPKNFGVFGRFAESNTKKIRLKDLLFSRFSTKKSFKSRK